MTEIGEISGRKKFFPALGTDSCIVAALSAVLLFSLIIRICYLMTDPTLDRDAIVYLQLSENWADVRASDSHYPPLFLRVLYLIGAAGGSPESWGVAVNIGAGVGLCLLAYLCGRELLGNRWIALGMAFIAAVQPFWVKSSCSLLREPLYLLFFAGGIYCFLRFLRTGKRFDAVCCGVLAACCTLSRYEGAALLIYFGTFLALEICMEKRRFLSRLSAIAWIAASFVAGIFLLLLSFDLPLNYCIRGALWRL